MVDEVDQSAYFEHPEFEQQLDLISHLVQFGEDMLIIIGPAGIGKSVALTQLHQRMASRWMICEHLGQQQPLLTQLFQNMAIAYDFDYNQSESETLIVDFQEHLLQQQHKSALLLIDDADQLETETLEFVFHLATIHKDGQQMVKVVLFGNDSLQQRLRAEKLEEKTPFRYLELPPIATEYIPGYIEFCQQHGKAAVDSVIDEKQIAKIARKSKGNPFEIELQLQLPEVAAKSASGIYWKVALALFIVAIVATLSYMANWQPEPITVAATKESKPDTGAKYTLQQPKELPQQNNSSLPQDQPKPDLQVAPTVLVDQQTNSSLPLVVPVAVKPTPQQADAIEPEQPEVVAKQTSDEPKVADAVVVKQESTWLQQQSGDNYTIQLVASSDGVAVAAFVVKHKLQGDLHLLAGESNGKPVYYLVLGSFDSKVAAQAHTKTLPASLSVWVRPFGSLQQLQLLEQSVATAIAPVENDVATPLRVETVTQPIVNNTKTGLDIAWLWSQSPAKYTVQLVGSSEKSKVEQYIAQHEASLPMLLVTLRRDGKPWYIAVTGSYEDRTIAMQAIGKMDKQIRSNGPWARSFASLHKELSR